MWKEIKGYEGIYKINEYGKVIKIKNNYEMSTFDNDGYDRIQLTSKNGVAKKHLIHRLVLSTFKPTKNWEEMQVNHKDMNKRNNHISNLEWVNNKQNINHMLDNRPEVREQLKKSMSKIGKKYNHLGAEASKKPVARIDLKTNEVIDIFESAREASRKTGANYKNISQVCNEERKTHMGFGWKFI
jgi:hypothetical protein